MKPIILILLGFAELYPTYILLLRRPPIGGDLGDAINGLRTTLKEGDETIEKQADRSLASTGKQDAVKPTNPS